MPSPQMTKTITDAVLLYADGITAKDMAQHLTWKVTKASQIMGVLYFKGILDRRNAGAGIDRRNNQYVYTVRPTPVAAATPAWMPSPRISDSPSERLPKWAREIAVIADRLAEGEVV